MDVSLTTKDESLHVSTCTARLGVDTVAKTTLHEAHGLERRCGAFYYIVLIWRYPGGSYLYSD
jgi:hypothetical protein